MVALRKQPTLADIAQKAGVAKSTVSRVLNGREDIVVSPATRQRILQIAADVQYQPNAAARRLTAPTAQAIGLYVRSTIRLRNLHIQEIVAGISAVAADRDASLIWYFAPSDRKDEFHLSVLQDGRVDVGIVIEDRGVTPAVLAEAACSLVPIVFVGNYFQSQVPMVGADDEAGAISAARHLADLGHERILCLGARGTQTGEQRVDGFMAGLQERGLTCTLAYIDTNFRLDLAYASMKKALAQPQPPTAVFAVNDLSAMAAIQAVFDFGKSVPADVSVIGFNNLSFTQYSYPALTTVERPLYEMGKEACRLALLQAHDPNSAADSPRQIIMPTVLRIRASTGPCRHAF